MLDSSRNNHLILALANFTERIDVCISRMRDEMHIWQPDEDNWSIQMILAHLLHCEPLFRKRLERIAREKKPTVPGFSPKEAVPYSDKSTHSLLDALTITRKTTLEQIYTYTVEDWAREAVHSVQGETTLGEQIEIIVKHDTEHLGQMYDLCETWQAQRNHEELT